MAAPSQVYKRGSQEGAQAHLRQVVPSYGSQRHGDSARGQEVPSSRGDWEKMLRPRPGKEAKTYPCKMQSLEAGAWRPRPESAANMPCDREHGTPSLSPSLAPEREGRGTLIIQCYLL